MKKKKVLVIDDDLVIHHSFMTYLRSKDFIVFVAENGKEGLHVFHHKRPDLVFLDLYMPKMDGFEVLKLFREQFPKTPVIAISATQEGQTALETIRLGAWDFMFKPILDMSILEHTIYRVLERANLLKENERHQEHLERSVQKLQKLTEDLSRENQERKEAENKFSALLQHAPYGIITTNEEGEITLSNLEIKDLFGYSQEDLYGKKIETLIPERFHESHLQYRNEYDNSPRVFHMGGRGLKLYGKHKSGKEFPIDVSLSTVEDKGKTLTIATIQDLSEFQKVKSKEEQHRQQLEQTDKLASLGTLVAGVAHEINNPNSFIMLNAPILQGIWEKLLPILEEVKEEKGNFSLGNLNYETVKERIPFLHSAIHEGAQRIKVIVRDLKDFAKQNTVGLNQLVNLNEVVHSSVALTRNRIKEATLHFHVDCMLNLPIIRGNFQRIEQVVINLIINACEALSDQEQKIEIATLLKKEQGIILLQVKDGGSGISPEILKKIKDPFFTTKRDAGGTGLGLSISDGIIQEHGGTLVFDSVQNQGTTVTIQLPILRKSGL